MAKEDFCFTYYDGDAARDMAHMNRLERGGYHDLIVSQRKFGHLSLALIKKTLGSDFDQVWDAIKIVLKTDAQENFFIDWLEVSIQKMQRQSVKQKENGKKGGRPKAKENPVINPIETQTQTQEKPLGDGDGIEEGFKEEGTGETIEGSELIIPVMMKQFEAVNPGYPADQFTDFPSLRMMAEKIHKYLKLPGRYDDASSAESIKFRWGELIDHIRADPHLSGYSLSQINKYFQSIVQSHNNGRGEKNRGHSTGKVGTSAARIAKAKQWGLSAGEQVPGVDQGG